MNLKIKIAAVLIMTGLVVIPVQANYNKGKTNRKVSASETHLLTSANENEVMIEEWMTTINYFHCNNNSYNSEKGIEISNWMYDPYYFSSENLLPEKEYDLTIQPWMSDPGYFRTK
jgi:hypothetical protein